MSAPFTRADLDAATAIVGIAMPPTPTFTWPLLTAAVGTEVWVKHENHSPVGAFKVRGGLVFVEHLRTRRPEATGLVSATRGNHGQSLSFAGARAGMPVTIVVPAGNSPDKNAAMRGFGATVIEHGHDYQSAREHAGELAAADPSLEIVPPPITRTWCSASRPTPGNCSSRHPRWTRCTSRSAWDRESAG